MFQLRPMAALSLAVALASTAGCDAVSDFRLNQAVNDYRMACFGDGSNDCGDMLVDTNIMMLENFRESVDAQKDKFVAQFGEDGLEALHEMVDGLIEKQEDMRPGFFTLGGGQYAYAGRNFLMGDEEFNEIKLEIFKKYASKEAIQAAIKQAEAERPKSMDEIMAEEEAVAKAKREAEEKTAEEARKAAKAEADARAKQEAEAQLMIDFEAALAKQVQEETAKEGGEEYQEARLVEIRREGGIYADMAATRLAAIYTIEGFGGGKGSYSKLAFFEPALDGYGLRVSAQSDVEGRAVSLKNDYPSVIVETEVEVESESSEVEIEKRSYRYFPILGGLDIDRERLN